MHNDYSDVLIRQEINPEPIPKEVRAEYLRPGELLSILEKLPVAFQPFGTIEWHGRHNPLGVDTIKSERLCCEAAAVCGGVVMPSIHFGTDAYWDMGNGIGLGMDAAAGYLLPGSYYYLPPELFRNFVYNICKNYLDRGIKLVVLISGHNPTIQQNIFDEICHSMRYENDVEPVIFAMDYNLIPPGDKYRNSDHAAFVETSMMLHLCDDRVNMLANDGYLRPDLGQLGDIAYHYATKEEGKIRFEKQLEGLITLVRAKLARLEND